MTTATGTNCCGVTEIDGIMGVEPDEILKGIRSEVVAYSDYRRDTLVMQCAHVMFTDLGNQEWAKKLAKFIAKNDMGLVIRTKARRNPNTGRNVGVWIWSVAPKAVKKWYLKHDPENSEFWNRGR